MKRQQLKLQFCQETTNIWTILATEIKDSNEFQYKGRKK